jgi:hypothetical protein
MHNYREKLLKVSGRVRQYSHFRETFGGDLFRSALIGRGDSYFEDFWRRLLIAQSKGQTKWNGTRWRRPLANEGLLDTTLQGDKRRHPLIKVIADAASDMVRYAGEFGLTPVARTRIVKDIHQRPPSKFDGYWRDRGSSKRARGRGLIGTPDVRFRRQSGLPLRPGECLLMTRSGLPGMAQNRRFA